MSVSKAKTMLETMKAMQTVRLRWRTIPHTAKPANAAVKVSPKSLSDGSLGEYAALVDGTWCDTKAPAGTVMQSPRLAAHCAQRHDVHFSGSPYFAFWNLVHEWTHCTR